MFDTCKNLTYVNFTYFDTSELKDMRFMFYYATNLTKIILGNNFSTKKITTLRYLFNSCYSLTSVNLSMFNTSNVRSFDYMFNVSFKLEKLE